MVDYISLSEMGIGKLDYSLHIIIMDIGSDVPCKQ